MAADLRQQQNPPQQKTSLLLVLAAVEIASVPDIADYIPKIQSALRLAGYPINEVNAINEIQISPEGVQAQITQQWGFYDVRKRNGIRISSSRFILETSAYTTFVDFIPHIEKALAPLEAIGLMAVNRIGIRYINAVQPRPGEEFDQYLHERLSGLGDDFVGIRNTTFAAAIQGETDERTTLSIRIHQPPLHQAQEQTVLLPPDLQTQLRLPELIVPNLRYRLLDLDHQGTVTEEFSVQLVVEALEQLHHKVGEAFKNSLQDAPYKLWAKQ